MDISYKKTIIVQEPECDIGRKLRLSGIMQHSQQMGSDHLHQLGIGYAQMFDDGMVFLVNKMLITMSRRPVFDEKLTLITEPKVAKGAQFIRDTYFETEAGERIVEVSISWMLINPHTRKILRPSAFDRYGFEMNPNDGEYITGYRIKRPEQCGDTVSRAVRYSDLDYNLHVNNAVYADMVCDSIPFELLRDREISRFGIIYQREAKHGAALELETVGSPESAAFYVGGTIAGERCFESEIIFL